jgi:hypothetical protein
LAVLGCVVSIILLGILVVLLGGGAALFYYFRVYRNAAIVLDTSRTKVLTDDNDDIHMLASGEQSPRGSGTYSQLLDADEMDSITLH